MAVHLVKCQYCPEIVERTLKTRMATCFTCRSNKQRAYSAARAKHLPLPRRG
jgi:hypothetical protein